MMTPGNTGSLYIQSAVLILLLSHKQYGCSYQFSSSLHRLGSARRAKVRGTNKLTKISLFSFQFHIKAIASIKLTNVNLVETNP